MRKKKTDSQESVYFTWFAWWKHIFSNKKIINIKHFNGRKIYSFFLLLLTIPIKINMWTLVVFHCNQWMGSYYRFWSLEKLMNTEGAALLPFEWYSKSVKPEVMNKPTKTWNRWTLIENLSTSIPVLSSHGVHVVKSRTF